MRSVVDNVMVRDVKDRAGRPAERLDALAVLGHPNDLQLQPGGQIGHPVGNSLIRLDLEDGQVRRNGEAVLGGGTEVKIPVATPNSLIDRDPQPEVRIPADKSLPLVAGDRGGPQIEAADQAEHLVDETLVRRRVLDELPVVAEQPGLLVGRVIRRFWVTRLTRCLIST